MPDIPPNIVRCVRDGTAPKKAPAKAKRPANAGAKAKDGKVEENKGPGAVQAQAPSADALVLASVKDRAERLKCVDALIQWYRALQKTQQLAQK